MVIKYTLSLKNDSQVKLPNMNLQTIFHVFKGYLRQKIKQLDWGKSYCVVFCCLFLFLCKMFLFLLISLSDSSLC